MKVFTGQLDLKPEYDLRSICPLEEMLLFDIETTGLKRETTQLYLIGCVWYRDGIWCFRQYLTENAGDEYYILEAFLKFASEFRMLVHFNGDGFDLPYIQYKCDYYGTETDLSGLESYDIYKAAKCARRFLGLSSMSQKSIEQFLGIFRDDQYSGGLLIPVYYEYELTGSSEKEELLLLHNYDDLQGMLKLLPILAYRDMLNGRFHYVSAEEKSGQAVLNYELDTAVPVACKCQAFFTADKKRCWLPFNPDNACPEEQKKSDICIYVSDRLLQIVLRIQEGTGLVPLENITDYYYLPEEDRVIHKDVAQFLDRSRRVKATRKTCVLKKKGRFIPQLSARFSPGYYMGEDRKQQFLDWEELKEKIQAKNLQTEKNQINNLRTENSQTGDPAYPETLKGMAQDILDLVSSL